MDATNKPSRRGSAALELPPLTAASLGAIAALELLLPGFEDLLVLVLSGVVTAIAYSSIVFKMAYFKEPKTPKMKWTLTGIAGVVGFFSGTLTAAMARLAQGG